MKSQNIARIKICPYCGQRYTEPSAMSRKDNTTAICPDCGTREALTSIGVAADEQEQILDTIHRSTFQNND